MNAVILVGGGGTRLRPLTYALPKPLLPVLNRPMLEHLLLTLAAHGVDTVVLAASAAEPRIEAALGDGSKFGIRLRYSYETEPLGSGLAVKQAAKLLDGRFFVCNGDVITNLDLSAMLRRHIELGALMSVSLTPVSDPSSFGIAETEPDGRLSRFLEKPSPGQTRSRSANAGTWIFEPEVLELIPDQKMDGSIERLVMPLLIGQGQLVLGFASDAYWMDAGTPERYLQLHQDLLSGRIPEWLTSRLPGKWHSPEVDTQTPRPGEQDAVLIGEGTRLGDGSQLKGRTILGKDCSIGDESLIAASVLWDNVNIGASTTVHDSIVGDGCTIGDGCQLKGAVLASGSRVNDNVQLGYGARLAPGEVAS